MTFRRIGGWWLATTVAAAMAAVLMASSSARSEPDPTSASDSALLARHAPIVVLADAADALLHGPKDFVERSSIHTTGGEVVDPAEWLGRSGRAAIDRQARLVPGTDDGFNAEPRCARDWLPPWLWQRRPERIRSTENDHGVIPDAQGYALARVVDLRPWGGGRWLQYFFFSEESGSWLLGPVASHGGDWMSVALEIEPLTAAMSTAAPGGDRVVRVLCFYHGDPIVLPAGRFERAEDGRLVLWLEARSHEVLPGSGRGLVDPVSINLHAHRWRPSRMLLHLLHRWARVPVGRGEAFDLRPGLVDLHSRGDDVAELFLSFPGLWGEAGPWQDAPRSPAFQPKKWRLDAWPMLVGPDARGSMR